MHHVGIDLHKNPIVLCVPNDDLKATHRRTFACAAVDDIRASFAGLGPFRAVVEAAWRLVRRSRRRRSIHEGIKKRRGGEEAIVAVARRLPGAIVAMLRTRSPYRLAAT